MVIIWCLIFLSISGVHSQLDSIGFVSIDCGYPDNSTYVDSTTGITYTSDTLFIDTGANYDTSAEYRGASLSKIYLNVRSFETGTRNCYTLKSLTKGLKYLIRASFLYGNYDRLNDLVTFDLYIGVNYWKTVNVSDPASTIVAEVITVIQDDYIQVCLVNTGMGTPFISGLELRPINYGLYPAANKNQSIVLYNRVNAGPINNGVIR
ncbi:probable LRR receptor-like serine/threonine-protein kinase At4g29180 [Typha latifolia]|uniref:probable LRR receptor-like serine/threonine-protein kinase At4g29180 n=1 Tax=Typha latifolia TaxID=4733 RepID=UPI003C2AD434